MRYDWSMLGSLVKCLVFFLGISAVFRFYFAMVQKWRSLFLGTMFETFVRIYRMYLIKKKLGDIESYGKREN